MSWEFSLHSTRTLSPELLVGSSLLYSLAFIIESFSQGNSLALPVVSPV